MKIQSNPRACWKNNKPLNCIECYNSNVNKNNQWIGSDKCWSAGCVVLADEEIERFITNLFNGTGTYNIHFNCWKDETQFYAEKATELIEFWREFCRENDFVFSSFCGLEFVCEEDI